MSEPSDPDPRNEPSVRARPATLAWLALVVILLAIGASLLRGMPRRGDPRRGIGDTLAGPGVTQTESDALRELREEVEARALEHVVLQLDYSLTGLNDPWPDLQFPWGRVPEFTLFDDGTVVYIEDPPGQPPSIDSAFLAPDAAQALVDQAWALGLDRVDDSEVDAEWPEVDVVRARRDGQLHAVKWSVDKAGVEPQLVEWLRDWTAESAVPLDSTTVTAFPDEPTAQTLAEIPFGDARIKGRWPDGVPWPGTTPFVATGDVLETLRLTAQDSYRSSTGPGYPAPGEDAARLFGGLWAWSFFREVDPSDPRVDEAGHWILDDNVRLVVVPWIYPYYDHGEDLARVEDARRALVVQVATAEAVPQPTEVPQPSPTETAPTAIYPFPPQTWPPPLELGVGIQTWQYWWSDTSWEHVQNLKAQGFRWLKQRFAWRDMQPEERGGINWELGDYYVEAALAFDARDPRGRTFRPALLLIQLDAPPEWAKREGEVPWDLEAWSAFVHAVADHYRGKVVAYEIMNEPNLAREWGGPPDPVAYAKMLAAAYQAIKTADPGATVISAGLAPTGDQMPEAMADDAFVNGLYDAIQADAATRALAEAAGLQPGDLYFDALGAHAPGFKAAPIVSPEQAAADSTLGGQRYFTFRRVEDLRAIMEARGDSDKQVVITEFGWTVDPRPNSPYRWAAVTPRERAEFIRDALAYAYSGYADAPAAWDPWVGPMILFTAADPAWTKDDEAYWWSVTAPDGQVSPVVLDVVDDLW